LSYVGGTLSALDAGGTVTSVTAQGSADISVTGGPITTSGTLYFSLSDTTVVAGNYGSASSVASITVDAKGRITAASSVPIVVSNVSLTASVTGTLPVGNGGTGLTSVTANYLIKGNGTSALQTSQLFDDGTKVGIATTAPASRLDISGNYAQNAVAVSALSIDCSAGNYFTKTISADSTFTFDTVPASRAFAFVLELTHTSGAVNWPNSVKWPNDTAPTLTTGKTHIFVFVTDDGGTRWRGGSLINYVD
jgi:hypothetical protein